jgi:hypothetical protein
MMMCSTSAECLYSSYDTTYMNFVVALVTEARLN